jgi:methionyl-tRNA formyltransferase
VLVESGVEVELVVTHADDPKEEIWFANVATLARSLGIDVLVDPPVLDFPETDYIFSFYYRRMLPKSVLDKARLGAYNMHGSLLPKYRGRAPVNWAILCGEKETGATLHEMTEKPDAGGIVDQEAVPIGPDDQAVDVFRKVTIAAEEVLRRSMAGILAGKVKLKAQDLSKGSYFGGRRPEDGRIDWSKSAQEVHNLVRAVAPPYPGAFTDGMRVLRTRLAPKRKAPLKHPPGPYFENREWFAVCGDGKVLRLLEVEILQKKK